MENQEMLTGIIEYPNQSNGIGKLALALSKAQGKMSGASKSSENPFFKSKYADLNACLEAAREPLSENELAVIQTTESTDSGVTIITTLCHSSGEWIRGYITMTPKKNDDQGRGSSITYGRRYAFAAIVGLAQKDDDGNAASHEPEKKERKVPTVNEEAWEDKLNNFADPDDPRPAQERLELITNAWKEHVEPKLNDFTKKGRTSITNTYNGSVETIEYQIKDMENAK